MATLKIVIEREDEHHFSAKINDATGATLQAVHRVKKATSAIGNLVWGHKTLFNIRETPYAKEGLDITDRRSRRGVFVFINGQPTVKPEYAESFDTALGQLVKHNQKVFGVTIDHIGR